MMNQEQHCLLKLSEECNEVGQIVSKIMQFGMDEKHPELDENNRERLFMELNDIHAMIQMLNEKFDLGYIPSQEAIDRKKEKVEHYLRYSQSLGMVGLD